MPVAVDVTLISITRRPPRSRHVGTTDHYGSRRTQTSLGSLCRVDTWTVETSTFKWRVDERGSRLRSRTANDRAGVVWREIRCVEASRWCCVSIPIETAPPCVVRQETCGVEATIGSSALRNNPRSSSALPRHLAPTGEAGEKRARGAFGAQTGETHGRIACIFTL